MNRIIGLLIVGLWLTALAALIHQDVLPYFRAQDPPQGDPPMGDTQVGIFDSRDQRVGTSWLSIKRQGEGTTLWVSTTRLSLAVVPGLSLPGVPDVIFDTKLSFNTEQMLTGFETQVVGLPTPVEVKGELIGIDYSCVANLGGYKQTFSLDARISRGLADAMRPFTHLSSLHVGQSWQVQMLNPLSLLQPAGSPEFRPVLVEVAGVDVIPHGGKHIECFHVQADRGQTNAWVDRAGRVLVQTVQVGPLKITLRDEPFDERGRKALRAGMRERAIGSNERAAGLKEGAKHPQTSNGD